MTVTIKPGTVQPADLPIVVDLDHSLLPMDSLEEAFAHAVFTDPASAARAAFALKRGPLAVKQALATHACDVVATLPFRDDLLEWLRAEAQAGRTIHLCTASHQSVADVVAGRVGFLADAVGSTTTNLKGGAKAEFLARRFPGGFVYAGDSHADLQVWRRAGGIVLVNASASTVAAARRLGPPVIAEFSAHRARLKDWARAIRVPHWTKNALVFVPLILGQSWHERLAVPHAVIAFLLLLMLTSSTYLLNDVADLRSDRLHWSKRHRPIASGRIRAGTALAAGIGGAIAAPLFGWILSSGLGAALAAYLALTLAYSLGLKRVALLDVVVIGLLFGLRLVVGVAVLAQPFSGYLMTFALFFFFSLAIAKRHTEILRAGPEGTVLLALRGYRPDDAGLTLALGVAAGLGSIIVLVQYLMQDAFLRVPYARPAWLWAAPLLIAIWLGRIWLLSHRGEMLDDPVGFAVRDRFSWALGAGVLAAYLLAL